MDEQISHRRILIVEDDVIIAKDLENVLERWGYDVTGVATSSEHALSQAEADEPDLVLMDIRLRGATDGVQTADALRARMDVPIVFLTANTDAQTRERALDTNAAGYIAKPYNPSTLLAAIELAFRRRDSDRATQRAHEEETARLRQKNAELTQLTHRLEREATHDALTGLFNRRHLDTFLNRELSLAKRTKHAIGVILLDLDHFKRLNDTFGHVAGDAVLQAVANYLRSRLRSYDVACRYGGEEIVIVAPGASLQDTAKLAEQLRAGIEQLKVESDGKLVTPITASFGVASFPQHGAEPEMLLKAADAALYDAKSSGRNRVSISSAGGA
jgi:diguanylate cyclase (GGDEF)-like protein